MFGQLPMAVATATLPEYARMRDYYRLVTGKHGPGHVDVEKTGVEIEEGAVIVE